MADTIEEVLDIGPMELGGMVEPPEPTPVRRIRHIPIELLWPEDLSLDVEPMIVLLDSLIRSYGGEGVKRPNA